MVTVTVEMVEVMVLLLTALTLLSSLQVLSSPLCSTSFCCIRVEVHMEEVVEVEVVQVELEVEETLCSLSSWLADSRAVSRVCCKDTWIKYLVLHQYFKQHIYFLTWCIF